MGRYGWSEEDIYLVAERAHSLYLQGRFREAAIVFEGLVSADPDNQYCREALAAVWLALEEPQRAVDELTRLLARDEGNLAARARRFEASIRHGDLGAALADFDFLKFVLPQTEIRRLELQLQSAAAKATFPGERR